MPTGLSRRNGKAASCEPCRKAKIRCDHQKPCQRCQHRGLSARCVYHPAPLTRPRGPSSGQIVDFDSDPTAEGELTVPAQTRPTYTNTTNGVPGSGVPLGLQWQTASTAKWDPQYRDEAQATDRSNEDASKHEYHVKIVKGVLRQLKHLPFMDQLIRELHAHAQAALTPSPIVLAMLDTFHTTVSSLCSGTSISTFNENALESLARLMIYNTSQPVELPADLKYTDFVALYTGDNLRLETVGLMYCLSVRSLLLGLAGDDHKREDFVRNMCDGSYSLLEIAREVAPAISDVIAWLSFEDNRRTTMTDGDSSPIVWRKLGNLITDIYAARLHRESNNAKVPFWLAECRRKNFSAVFQSDKFIATLMELPPRILSRYCDTKMPLNLTDNELLGASCEEEARQHLTPDGWSTNAKYIPSTWTRMRFILGQMREEILEYPSRPQTLETKTKLYELMDRLYQRWDTLPKHLHYTSSCWDAGLSMPVCLMLTVCRLNFLQGVFMVHRVLEHIEPESTVDLVRHSAEIVSTVHDIGKNLNRAIFLRHDFPYIVLCYGLPAAAILVNLLQDMARSGNTQSLPSGLSRSMLIRQLSVFICHLESIYTPGEVNYNVCTNAAKAISRTLDEALELSATPSANVSSATDPQTPASAGGNQNNQLQPNINTLGPSFTPLLGASQRGEMDLDILSTNGLDGFDFATWMKDIDWTGTAGEWSNL